ncbi:acylphosphatase, partial [Anaerorhabdus sp.]
MKRYYIIIEGQVQGVGFRSYTQLNAIKYNCTGWVRNMDNGMVEIQIQG